jgi:hypothetical protein
MADFLSEDDNTPLTPVTPRQKAMAKLVAFARAARDAGRDPAAALRQEYPDIPGGVVFDVMLDIDDGDDRWLAKLVEGGEHG